MVFVHTVHAKDAVAIHVVCCCQVVESHTLVYYNCPAVHLCWVWVWMEVSLSCLHGVRPDMAHLAWSGMQCTQLATGDRFFVVMPVRLFLY